MTLPGTPPKGPAAMRVPSLRFMGEQDGEPEQRLKSRLVECFKQRSDVHRAYLAQVSAGDQLGVALCLKTADGPDLTLVRAVGAVFSNFFAKDEHLDILFLNASQESALTKVCAAFFAHNDAC
jgi:hypothetical protein